MATDKRSKRTREEADEEVEVEIYEADKDDSFLFSDDEEGSPADRRRDPLRRPA